MPCIAKLCIGKRYTSDGARDLTIYQCLFHLGIHTYSNALPCPKSLIFSENTTSHFQSILAAGKVINVDFVHKRLDSVS